MKTFLGKWTPELSIAFFVVIVLSALMMMGIDGEVKSIFTLTVGWIIRSTFQVAKAK